MEAHLFLEPRRTAGDTIEVAARFEHSGGSHRLWWKLPAHWEHALTSWADPYVLGFLFPAMQLGVDVRVEGCVSPSLLTNLETYMAICHAWHPDKYRPVQFRAALEKEETPPAIPGQAIMPFSCGIDSSYTAFRHCRDLVGRRRKKIGAAIIMHGFDIRLDQPNGVPMYNGMLAGAQVMLDSLGVPCIPIASNFYDMPVNWEDSHGSHLVASLRLFSRCFDTGLIANGIACTVLDDIWGLHPFTDPFLGSMHFPVFHDGTETLRVQKAELVAQWPQAMTHLRVCYGKPGDSHVNCCRCEKCIRSILAFRIAGVPLPAAFKQDITARQIRRVNFPLDIDIKIWHELIHDANQRGMANADWIKAMHTAINSAPRRRRWKALQSHFIPLRNKVRKLLRGSSLSRRQLANAAYSQPSSPAE